MGENIMIGEMPDLNFTLKSFQNGFRDGDINPRPGTVNSEIFVFGDEAGGSQRITYADIQNGAVLAIAVYFLTEPYKGIHCFQVGYAVAEEHRNKGIATALLEKSIAELRHLSKRHVKSFYVEAVVEENNLASMKVAGRVLSPHPESKIDGNSGQPAFQYLRLIET
jgi:GNAT superfamily N-acetyltransferase